MTEHQGLAHEHGAHPGVELSEDDWRHMAAQAERQGELFGGFVTEAIDWVGELRGGAPVDDVLDVGSGPGVAACTWAERLPGARVVAVDPSPAMLARAGARIRARGLDGRVTTRQGELPGGLGAFAGTADVAWISMALHHVGDEVAALRSLAACLRPGGLLVIAEFGDPVDVLPAGAEADLGRPGLAERIERASAAWYANMRAGLAGSAPSSPVESMVVAAGLRVVGSRLSELHLPTPLGADARVVVADTLGRVRHQLGGRLDADDLAAIAVLLDPDDPRGVLQRPDATLTVSRRLVVAAG